MIAGTPSDLSHLMQLDKPVIRARYEFAEVGEPRLSRLIEDFLRRARHCSSARSRVEAGRSLALLETRVMPINLKGRSILTLDELTAAEIRFLLRLAAELKAAKSAGIEAAAAQGQEHRPHLREGLDAHAHRLRGGGLRPGRARHLPRPHAAARSATRSP